MLDKDVIKSMILMNCGCRLSHRHFMASGLHHDNTKDHIKHRYGIDMDTDSIRDLHDNIEKLRKITDTIEIDRLCGYHTNELMMNILIHADKYYEQEKEKLEKYQTR